MHFAAAVGSRARCSFASRTSRSAENSIRIHSSGVISLKLLGGFPPNPENFVRVTRVANSIVHESV